MERGGAQADQPAGRPRRLGRGQPRGLDDIPTHSGTIAPNLPASARSPRPSRCAPGSRSLADGRTSSLNSIEHRREVVEPELHGCSSGVTRPIPDEHRGHHVPLDAVPAGDLPNRAARARVRRPGGTSRRYEVGQRRPGVLRLAELAEQLPRRRPAGAGGRPTTWRATSCATSRPSCPPPPPRASPSRRPGSGPPSPSEATAPPPEPPLPARPTSPPPGAFYPGTPPRHGVPGLVKPTVDDVIAILDRASSPSPA